MQSGGVASGYRTVSASFQSAIGSSRQRSSASPTRRLRFEDETETEVESRYVERQQQRRHTGQRGTGVLVSKPHQSLYIIKTGAGLREAGPLLDRQQRRVVGGQSLGDLGVNLDLDLCLQPPVTNDRGRSLNLRTEPIRETYIGSITTQVERNGAQRTKTTPTTDLPINPYGPHGVTTPPQPLRCTASLYPPPMTTRTHARANGSKAAQDLNQNLMSYREQQCGGKLKEEDGLKASTEISPSSSSSSAGRGSGTTST